MTEDERAGREIGPPQGRKHKDWAARCRLLVFSKRILGKRMTGLSHDRPLRSGQATAMPIGGHGSGHGHASAGRRC
jgi:hypothetical protein